MRKNNRINGSCYITCERLGFREEIMEGKQWLLPLLLVLLLVAVSMDLSGHHLQSPFTEGCKYVLRSPSSQQVRSERQKKGIALKANLSSCHPSFTNGGDQMGSCCPPAWPVQQIVDFKFPDPSSPIRVRRAAHLVDEEYKAKYKRAVAIMKELPLDHPHNFWRQADLHCLYCTGGYNQVNSTAPFKIHHSWLFFPWHRALLYIHERILGKLIGDDNFALTYWSWDHPDGMHFPTMFTEGVLNNTQRDTINLPRVVDDNYRAEDRGLTDSEQILDNLALLYHQMVSGAKKPELFMGCKFRSGVEGYCEGEGTVEEAPHSTVHGWVGNRNNPFKEDMGAFHSAGLDPILYAHHPNVDRMWATWQKMRDNELEFDDEEWLDTEFNFYDENLQLVRIRVRDVLDMSKLRYEYEGIGLPWLDARPKPSVPPEIARSILKKRHDHGDVVLLMPGETPEAHGSPGNWRLDKPITVRVERPRINRTKKEKEEEEEVLFIYGIDTKKSSFVKFDVFINVVEETVLSPQSREFAGIFARIHDSWRYGKEGKKVKPHLKLGISELLEDLQAEGDDNIWVTLVPRGGTAVNTTVEGMRVEFMK
ncbi:polyphenol oxidase I, chloroplastic-like [Canna indica]|uniref:Polyphenol oxidase I, chloroplastic-like n=1 Tax=Canna indica TaxID=4628 RepID=A0AAQ3QBY4_9LILI|nr:polyphenol oxidase I, chloroplastic-like [Canna indica]